MACIISSTQPINKYMNKFVSHNVSQPMQTMMANDPIRIHW